ncbi:MAG: PqqD family peptide modification chaperone [Actinomycetota bacterium]
MSPLATITPSRATGVYEGVVDGARVLFNSVDRRLHVLNPSAASLWDGLRHPTTVATLTAEVAGAFGVDAGSIRVEVERTLDRFVADGLAGELRRPATATMAEPLTRPVGEPATVIAALGTTIAIHLDAPMVSAAIQRVTAPLRTSAPADAWIALDEGDRQWTVTSSLGTDTRTGSRLAGVLRVVSEINNVVVAGRDDHLVFHAGAVARNGRAVLLPGSSNRGKSTLTTALVRAGFDYLTDEAAAVDATGVVHPFAKAIALDPGSFALFPDLAPDPANAVEAVMARREWHIDPSRLGGTAGPSPVAAIVCPSWRAGSVTRLARIGGTEAVHTLLGDAFDFAAGGADVFDILLDLVASVPVYRLRYSELTDAIATIDRVLAEA